jgi:plastocyanin
MPTTAAVSVGPSAASTVAPTGWVTTFEAATSAPAGATTIEMKGEAEIPTYAPPTVTVPSGTVVLFLVNIPISPPNFGPAHNVVIGPVVGGEALATSGPVQAGKSAVFTIENVPPGTYAFWCTVSAGHGPHYKLGQVGTLTVTP